MNRFKREAKRKHDEARIGLSPEEIGGSGDHILIINYLPLL